MATTKARHWGVSQIKYLAKAFRKDIGRGWDYMVPDVRRAMVDSFVLSIIRSQDRDAVTVESMDELYDLMHEAMGTER